MRIHIIAIGARMPAWIEAGYEEYARRLPRECTLVLHEIPARRRAKGADISRLIAQEGARQWATVPSGARVIALDRAGRKLDTEALATEIKKRLAGGEDLAFLIGGPEGLAPQLRELLQRQLDRGDVDPEELLRLLQRNASENVRLGKLVEANATSLKLAPLDGGDQVTLTLTPSTIIRRAGAAIKVSGLAPGEIVLVLSMDGGRTAFAVYAYGP